MELKFKGTPWPWEVDECGIITSKKFPYDGIGSLYDDQPTYEANKKLIAAAPELLDALIEMQRIWGELAAVYPSLKNEKITGKMDNAITKALGGV